MNLDTLAFYWIKDHLQSETLDIWVSVLTGKQIYIIPGIATVLAFLILRRKQGLVFLLVILSALGLSNLVSNDILKPLFGRLRPCHTLEYIKTFTDIYCSHSFSMPSVMVSNVFAVTTAWALFFGGATWGLLLLGIAAAFTRVYLGAHYLSDVLVATPCGILIGYGVYKLFLPAIQLVNPPASVSPVNLKPKNILIIKLSSLGDIIHSLPSLHALRLKFPQARITWLVEEKCKDLLYDNPDLDELFVVRIRHWRKDWNRQNRKEAAEAFRKLRREKYDLVVEMQGLLKTGVLARITGAPIRVGFHIKDCREKLNAWFTTHKIPYVGKKVHVIEKNMSMIQWLNADISQKEFPLAIPPEAESHIESYLRKNPQLTTAPLVAVHHGVGFETKRWPMERFAELSDRLSDELGVHVLLTWGPGEEEAVQKLSGMMKQPHTVAPPNTMHESMALFRHLKMMVACDTGPMHLSAALGIPTVSLFGPTDPEYSRPYGENQVVICKPQPCSFCHKRTCPTQRECMMEITVDDVFQAVQNSLQEHRKSKVS